jgi:hypothetical protein
MTKETGGLAFGAHPESANWHPSWQGMTLRDYFAAKAMQVFLTNERSTMTGDATAAYEMADAMLEARK